MDKTADVVDKEVQTFVRSRRTLILGTSNVENIPTASYAPFVKDGVNFYVFLSINLPRTRDILKTGCVSVLLVADEQDSKNIFARKRIEMLCKAVMVPRDCQVCEEKLALFHKKFGKIFESMPTLSDFNLFCLTPIGKARYVTGFGYAYDLYSDLTGSVRVRGMGHTQKVEEPKENLKK
ncbi:MAG: pyridoxamine 5'-phosphate oxidase family protein [Parcubacteria group bacterium]|nr:pyridoxamine 5'-phosphate oxidase family protein [Parcubacteria group bacterium]